MWMSTRKASPAPVALADHAVSVVGLHDARRARSLAQLREMEKLLDANIRRELAALAEVRSAISREEAADTVMAIEAASAEISAAIGEIEIEMEDVAVDGVERNLEDRRNGTERRPKRTTHKLTIAAAE